jgi:exonuclease 3'-5' domain-containing protein 1
MAAHVAAVASTAAALARAALGGEHSRAARTAPPAFPLLGHPRSVSARALPSRPPDRRRARPPAPAHLAPAPPSAMGNKAKLTCASCGAVFKVKTSTPRAPGGGSFCGVACAASAADRPGGGWDGEVPPAFGGGGGGGGGGGSTLNRAPARSDSDSDSGAGASKARKRKRKKKGRRSARGGDGAASASGGLPVEDDPRCLAVLDVLDRRRVVLTQPGAAFDAACEACANADRLAVDCEGTSMSRVGEVTLLQVALAANDDASDPLPPDVDGADDGADDKADDKASSTLASSNDPPSPTIFLFDVQALGRATLFESASGSKLKAALERPTSLKLMFDCRVDSDALFHQHGVSLRGVYDVQLADVASRRARSLEARFLPGVPKVAQRHLRDRGGSGVEAALGARGARRAEARSEAEGFVPGRDPVPGEAVSKVAAHLKAKVKALFASDRGGDSGLWAVRPMSEDVARYAALDAWLLVEIHDAMRRNDALDEEWERRVREASAERVAEYRDRLEPVLQMRDPERALAPEF